MSNENETEDGVESQTPAPVGYIQVPLLRGVFEIEPILDLLDKHGGKIIGGYARWCCSEHLRPVPAGDLDIFPVADTTEESNAVFENIKAALLAGSLSIEHENEMSISFSVEKADAFKRCPKIQLIKPVEKGAIHTAGTLESILDNFDFSVTRAAINPDRKTATVWAEFVEDEKRKLLRLLNIHCPISSLLRVMKYGRKGYYMRPGEAIKLFQDWDARSPEYKSSLGGLFEQGKLGKLTQKEIDELEALLKID
jgi:hypothetical protein